MRIQIAGFKSFAGFGVQSPKGSWIVDEGAVEAILLGLGSREGRRAKCQREEQHSQAEYVGLVSAVKGVTGQNFGRHPALCATLDSQSVF